jgi:hypothetical protein
MGTPTTIYGVVEKREGFYIDYVINDGKQKTQIVDDAKADKYVARYVKAEGYLNHIVMQGAGANWVTPFYDLSDVDFTIVKDCDAILQIINTPEFEKHFQISKRFGDSLTVYISDYGDLKPSELCNAVTAASGKTIAFAKVDFDIYAYDPTGKIINPRIVVWKENNQYHFVETETNRKLIASVKRGKVKDISTGVF